MYARPVVKRLSAFFITIAASLKLSCTLSHPPTKRPSIICVPPSTSTLYVREIFLELINLTITAITFSDDRAGWLIATITLQHEKGYTIG